MENVNYATATDDQKREYLQKEARYGDYQLEEFLDGGPTAKDWDELEDQLENYVSEATQPEWDAMEALLKDNGFEEEENFGALWDEYRTDGDSSFGNQFAMGYTREQILADFALWCLNKN